MKYIITESQRNYLRRIPIIDNLINTSVEMFDNWNNSEVNVDYMVDFITSDVAEQYFFRFEDIDEGEYDELSNFITSYLNSVWRDKIKSKIKSNRGK